MVSTKYRRSLRTLYHSCCDIADGPGGDRYENARDVRPSRQDCGNSTPNSAASLLSWDQETYMPAGGGQARAEQISTLQASHTRSLSRRTLSGCWPWVDPETGEARDIAGGCLGRILSRALASEVGVTLAAQRNCPRISSRRLSRESSLAQQVWVEAERKATFAFSAHLNTILALKTRRSRIPRLPRHPL